MAKEQEQNKFAPWQLKVAGLVIAWASWITVMVLKHDAKVAEIPPPEVKQALEDLKSETKELRGLVRELLRRNP